MYEAVRTQETLGALEITIDPETGEVITEQPITTELLPRVARRLTANRQELAEKTDVIKREIDRLMSVLDLYTTKYNRIEAYLLAQCEMLMRESGKDKLDYPGIGKFQIGMTRASVDSQQYEGFDDDQKADVHKQVPGCFRVKTTISPDKRAIMALLKDGQDIPGFQINEPVEKFEFKEGV